MNTWPKYATKYTKYTTPSMQPVVWTLGPSMQTGMDTWPITQTLGPSMQTGMDTFPNTDQQKKRDTRYLMNAFPNCLQILITISLLSFH